MAINSQLLLSSFANAATKVSQQVHSSISGSQLESTHTWILDDKKFQLNVKNKIGETSYFFNGRNFYVCSELSPQQISILHSNKITDKELIKKWENGVCQPAPSNFAVRFFLSPVSAVETINHEDGLKLTLAISKAELKEATQGEVVQSTSCQPQQRKMQLEKTHQNFKSQAKIEEQTCHAKELNWRKPMWREISKLVLRQSEGASLLEKLRQDYNLNPGLVLFGKSKMQTQYSQKSTPAMSTHDITTIKIDNNFKPSRKHFKIPVGYTIFNPENLDLNKVKTAKAASDKDEGFGVRDATSIFFCAISGAFGCFN